MKLDLRSSAYSALSAHDHRVSLLSGNDLHSILSPAVARAINISRTSQKVLEQKINQLRSDMFILDQPSLASCLVHENTPMFLKKGILFPLGITFATSQSSLPAVYEDVLNPNISFDNLPTIAFSRPICCVGGSPLFGHFLLQCLPKLINAKKFGLFGTHTFVFSSAIPSVFLKFADYLDLLPQDFVSLPPVASVTSHDSITMPITPIMSTVTLNSHLINASIDSTPDKFLEGYGLAFDLYQELHSLVLSCGYASNSSHFYQKVYLTRKVGVHRDLQNRCQILEIAISAGFTPLCIEDLSLPEQFQLFSECKFLITEVGSTACNAWMMPNLVSGIELCIDSVYGAWGLLLASSISGFKFYRVDGTKIPGTLKRFDSDSSKKALETDYDFKVNCADFAAALDIMLSM